MKRFRSPFKTALRPRRLNQYGVDHIVAMVVFVAIFAVVGIALFVSKQQHL
jgi:hypothetical protein